MIDRVNVRVMPDGRLGRHNAALYLGVATKTLANYRSRGVGPRCVRVGGKAFYYLADLEAFVAQGVAASPMMFTHSQTLPCPHP